MDDRQAEIVGVADRVSEVKVLVQEFYEAAKDKLEAGSTGLESLSKLVEAMGDKMDSKGEAGDEVKSMFEHMQGQFDESKQVVAGARLEANGKVQEAAELLGSKLDEAMAALMDKHDELRAAMEDRGAAAEARNGDAQEAVTGTKAVAEELRLLIDTLGSTVTDSLEKMEEASQIVFGKVEELGSRSDERHAEGKTEHHETRRQMEQTALGMQELRDEVRESQPKIVEAVKDLLLLVGEHFEHSKAAATEQSALPPPEPYDDGQVQAKLDRLAEQRYDDGRVQAKLDQLVEQAEQAFGRLEALQQSVGSTAADVSSLASSHQQRMADEHQERQQTLLETTVALERKLAQKEHAEAAPGSGTREPD
ncbi:hypothetical protein CDD81_7502 [Ophiocordyceps australis]|uniref:Uncharacterized protein n=1 Tax=Ophiocordyceps australis TaxID=1399860 RepID=A0A2C5YCK6_9HYPO|nr:hypothetical protein CDD81_7502 [Ophiocordyceps australis]